MGGAVTTGIGTRTTPPSSTRSRYRPQFDGLRAVAVYLVVAYHAGIRTFSGGFIGVDIFFVLSGYLVTLLLLRDLRSLGRINIRRFYSRRFRRLLPAAAVTLVVTAVAYTAVAAPTDVHNAIGGFRSAFLYVANWHFIRQSNDYFAPNVNTNPVVHFWSLAVEEQFYLCWPLLLSGAYMVASRAGDRRWKVVRLLIAVGAIVSLVSALHLSTVNVSRAYYGTDTRAYQLLAGALLAITPRIFRSARMRPRLTRILAPLSLAALVAFATSVIHLGPISRGVAVTAATCALIVTLEASKSGGVKQGLARPTAVYLGRVSYGTYLWHWPVIVLITLRYSPNPVALFALSCLIGTGLASLSFEVLEQPVRISSVLDRHRTAVIAGGLAISIIGGVFVVPAIMNRDRRAAADSRATLGSALSKGDTRVRVPATLDLNAIQAAHYGRPDCYGKPVSRCVIVHRRGPRMLLVGDSHAQALVPAFIAVARKLNLTLGVVTEPNCPWPAGVVEAPPRERTNLRKRCRSRQDFWYHQVLQQFDPNIVVLAHRSLDDVNSPSDVYLPNGDVVHADTGKARAALTAAATRTVDLLRGNGRKVVIIEPIPVAPDGQNPLTCLSEKTFLDDCRYVSSTTPTPLESSYRSLANGTDVFSLDLDRLVCPYLPICDPMVGGLVVKKDGEHITAAFSHYIGRPLSALLVADGIVSPTQ
jgi:peptidoglycan/LPS O-acetylase OafA/YrhL